MKRDEGEQNKPGEGEDVPKLTPTEEGMLEVNKQYQEMVKVAISIIVAGFVLPLAYLKNILNVPQDQIKQRLDPWAYRSWWFLAICLFACLVFYFLSTKYAKAVYEQADKEAKKVEKPKGKRMETLRDAASWAAGLCFFPGLICLLIFFVGELGGTKAAAPDDAKTVAALDTEYQEAVKKNDAATMDRILADDFVLVIGSGKVFTKTDLLEEARSGRMQYEHQEDSEQRVRLWGDTAVVTAKLWEKGTESGKPLDYTLWFSDTYVRTPKGWRYAFGQASLPLPTKQ